MDSSFMVYDIISSTWDLQRQCPASFLVDGEDNGLRHEKEILGMESPLQEPKPLPPPPSGSAAGKRKRRRTPRSCKNEEEAETQRMNHITVERNRRRLMNEHLAVLRSLMPASFVQRGDQASIVGGAINFVKELEHHLVSLEAQKRATEQEQRANGCVNDSDGGEIGKTEEAEQPPFAQFFAYPQYIWCHTSLEHPPASETRPPAVADIEVTLIETHANLRILSPRRPRQLIQMVAGIHALSLTILHLNVTTLDSMVFYSLSVKVEEGCRLTTVDAIAAAVHHMLSSIESETSIMRHLGEDDDARSSIMPLAI